ncbi:hypothetical protein HJFPF1_09564 [Paramyrothecium foliicola]|nr:hypothetical protein HJFPF1_09564 [Paramyrothecium foliicola]
MKINHSFLASAFLLFGSAVLAEPTGTLAAASTTTSAAPSCTASLITKLCDYKSPGPEFAVASSGIDHCLGYCDRHQPCDFVMFLAGNPYTGTGTCWVFPGETFDPSIGDTDCGNPVLSVFDKPTCSGTPTTTATYTCAATASPSAIAQVCNYPTPGDCWDGCYASSGASHCLEVCAKAESCSYVVFNPRNPSLSPYASGTCWLYPNGTYDAEAAGSCSGKPEQFVYTNPCPKPPPPPKPSSSEATASSASLSSTPTSSGGATSDTGAVALDSATGDGDSSAPATALSLTGSLTIVLITLLWQDLV